MHQLDFESTAQGYWQLRFINNDKFRRDTTLRDELSCCVTQCRSNNAENDALEYNILAAPTVPRLLRTRGKSSQKMTGESTRRGGMIE